ncbi:beta-N-acetylhexosaminidase [Acinetobacter nectaris]|uniref:beta-N-acetylhexosaminidase n=1 Tax=Acinetobacter nectaris TaxID=1219382 RepID=UPI001F021886|nr:beta-N-acetylhexosaminidase [Acinetobacter nectaris]MCF9033425.1 beta-N-acetylhexosaminidase [Acinetobacter nectaris]
MIGALMFDIEGTSLTQEDIEILTNPQVGGVILFSRNIESPKQVRQLTDHMREIRPNILIAVDQEGGRVQRLKAGFTRLPAAGKLGELYTTDAPLALELAENCGWLMATEALAVGIDFSFAPVLDLNNISDVIGDRSFSTQLEDIPPLAKAFMSGMHNAGMATTGKHFPGHGSVKADSHVSAAIDHRSFDEISDNDMQVFSELMPELNAIMPAHVIYPLVDRNPAGFSSYWLQEILRKHLNFDGVIFSDDLSMQAACIAGGADARIQAALSAGCDMGLVCNDRQAALLALSAIQESDLPDQTRLERMRGKIPTDIEITDTLKLSEQWQEIKNKVENFVQEKV